MSRAINELESHIEGFRRVKMIDILFGESLVMSVKTPMEAAHYIKDKTRCKASYDSVCSAVSKCLFGVQYATRGYRCSWETKYIRESSDACVKEALNEGVDYVTALLDKICGPKEEDTSWMEDIPERIQGYSTRLC